MATMRSLTSLRSNSPRPGANHFLAAIAFAVLLTLATPVLAQIHRVSDAVRQADLQREAEIIRMVRVPMRDGVHLATEIYLPKDRTGPVPVIFWRTPYNFSELAGSNPARPNARLKYALDAVRNGYAFVVQNERGKFFSEGEWEILGRPRTDGYDALTWLAEQSVVDRQGRDARLLVDRRVADGPGRDEPSGSCRRGADGSGSRHRPHGTVLRAG